MSAQLGSPNILNSTNLSIIVRSHVNLVLSRSEQAAASQQEETYDKVKILLYFGLENRHARGGIKPSLILVRKISIRKLPVITVNSLRLNDVKYVLDLLHDDNTFFSVVIGQFS